MSLSLCCYVCISQIKPDSAQTQLLLAGSLQCKAEDTKPCRHEDEYVAIFYKQEQSCIMPHSSISDDTSFREFLKKKITSFCSLPSKQYMFILEKQEHGIYAKKKKSQNFTNQRKLSTVIFFLASLMSFKCVLVFYGTEVCTSNSAVCFPLSMLLR